MLLAAVLREHLRTTTIRHHERVVSPINGKLFTQIVAQPDAYSLEIDDWREQDERLWKALFQCFGSHILPSERHHQPLILLPVMLVRWLQNQAHYCRQTCTLSAEALAFRDLIRQAQTEPARVLFHDLPKLLNVQADSTQDELLARLDSLASAISNAYLDLQRRLDNFVTDVTQPDEQAATDSRSRKRCVKPADRVWISKQNGWSGSSLSTFPA